MTTTQTNIIYTCTYNSYSKLGKGCSIFMSILQYSLFSAICTTCFKISISELKLQQYHQLSSKPTTNGPYLTENSGPKDYVVLV